MLRKDKKSFAYSKKFDEIEKDRKEKLKERSIQKKTGYERDLRSMSQRILEPLRRAELGEEELTRDDLLVLKNQIIKLIARSRILENNNKINLSRIRVKLETQRNLISDYIQGKQELAGYVKQKGERIIQKDQLKSQDNGVHPKPEQLETRNDFREYGYGSKRAYGNDDAVDKKSYFQNLGFDVDDTDEKKEDFIINPVPKPKYDQFDTNPISVESSEATTLTNRKIIINLIDETISNVINSGIEHLMYYRRDRKSTDLSYREEIIRYIQGEIVNAKRQSLQKLRDQGYNDASLREFSQLFEKEYAVNKNEMVRKCLYMSRVLEYRKGSTSSG